MEMILQIIVSGLATGGVYGLIALGFVLIYKATSVLNLAMGDFMTLGAFICLTVLEKFQAPFYVAFLVTLLCAFIIGVAVERVILRPLIGEPVISVIMVTIGLGVVLRGIIYMVWTPSFAIFRPYSPPNRSTWVWRSSPPVCSGGLFLPLSGPLSSFSSSNFPEPA